MLPFGVPLRRPVPGLLNRFDTVIDGDPGRHLDMGGVGGEVDGRRDTGQRVQLLLDPRRTRRAGHAFEIQVHGATHATSNGQPPRSIPCVTRCGRTDPGRRPG